MLLRLPYMLKDKLRHIKNFKSLLKHKSCQLGSDKVEVFSVTPLTGAQRRTFIEERQIQSKGIIDWL